MAHHWVSELVFGVLTDFTVVPALFVVGGNAKRFHFFYLSVFVIGGNAKRFHLFFLRFSFVYLSVFVIGKSVKL